MELEKYASWVLKNGGMIRTDLLEVHEFEDGTGRGIRAKEDIKEGELLVEAPDSCLLSAENICATLAPKMLRVALRNLRKKGKLNDTDLVALFLMWARKEKNQSDLDSAFVEYLSTLPIVENGPSPLNQLMFWTEKELEQVNGTDCFNIAQQLKQQVREDFGKLLSDVIINNQEVFPLGEGEDTFTYKSYKWALGIIWSRAMDFSEDKKSSDFRAIVPFADLFNTDFTGPITRARVLSKNVIQIRAKQNFGKGMQVFINYSPTSNTRLASLYGFAIRPPKNSAMESVQLWAVMSPGSPNFESARELLKQVMPGFDPNRQPFLLTEKDPLPVNLIVALHCQRLLPVPAGSTQPSYTVLKELEKALLDRRAKFWNNGDRMKDLQLALQAASLTERERIALYIRMTESSILEKTIQRLNAMITAVGPNEKDLEVPDTIDVRNLDEMD